MAITLEQRLHVHDVLARLDHAVDSQDWDTYLQHFTSDSRLDPGFAPPVQGIEAIRSLLVATEGGTRGKRHIATNVVIDDKGDHLLATSYLLVVEREEIPKVVATARIEDTFVEIGGVLKVSSHKVSVDPGMFKAMGMSQG